MNSIKISASILAADLSKIGDEVKAVCQAGVNFIHVDVMDGHFVPNITMGPQIVEQIKKHSSVPLDVHLMITNPENYVESFINAGADVLTVHAECENYDDALNQIIKHGAKAGISISPGTIDCSEIFSKLIPKVDLLLIMTVNPGFAGQKFMHEPLKKVVQAKAQAETLGRPNLFIAVDGGIDDKTAEQCTDAGANFIVSSSYIFRADGLSYKEKIGRLRRLFIANTST